jgi:hypothetical protein
VSRIDEQEREQADRQRQDHVEARSPQSGDEWIPQQAQGHRNHADVDPDQREGQQIL